MKDLSQGKTGFFVSMALSALIAAAGNLLLKKVMASDAAAGGGGMSAVGSPLLWTGFGLYGLSWILFIRLMSFARVSLVLPIFTAFSFLFVTLGAVLLLGEPFELRQVSGLVLILAGIAVSSRKEPIGAGSEKTG